jgi:hypothetical protein
VIIAGEQREAGSGATRVGQHRRPAWHFGLTEISIGHRNATARIPLLQIGNDRGIGLEGRVEQLRNGGPREIILRWTEPARADHDGRACERLARGIRNRILDIAYRHLPRDPKAGVAQLAAQECRIAVDGLAEEQFITDGDELDMIGRAFGHGGETASFRQEIR